VHSISRVVMFKHFVTVNINIIVRVLRYGVMWCVIWGQCVLKQSVLRHCVLKKYVTKQFILKHDETLRRQNTS
jgi:hypothetical protein